MQASQLPKKLSIITVNLNNKDGLQKTIESVVNQTFCDYEYIIIDGGSNDGSIEIIREFQDKITYWVSEPDKGIYNAMNKGIQVAKGEYLQFLNSGDWLYNDCVFQKFIEVNPKEDILYGTSLFLKDGQVVHKKNYPATLEGMELIYWTLNHQCIFFNSNLFRDGSRYNNNYKILADWVFYMDAIFFKKKTYKRLDFEVVYYDYSGFSSAEQNRERLKEERIKYYTENADFFIPHFLKEYDILKIKINEEERTKEKMFLNRVKRKLKKWL